MSYDVYLYTVHIDYCHKPPSDKMTLFVIRIIVFILQENLIKYIVFIISLNYAYYNYYIKLYMCVYYIFTTMNIHE